MQGIGVVDQHGRIKLPLTLVIMGGGFSKCPPPIFICENKRKRNKIMQCVEILFFSGSFEDKAIFHVIQEIDR